MMKYAIEAFVLGISMGGYCTASCAPFIIPYILADSGNKYSGRILIFLQFLAGRLLAYMIFAAGVSLFAVSTGPLLSAKLNSILLIAAALLMIVFSFFHTSIRFCKFVKPGSLSRGFPALTGFILGLNLCPPFLVAIVNVLKMKSVIGSCAYFLCLFIGTTVYLIPVVFVTAGFKSDFFKRVGTYLGFLAGVWFLIQGVAGMFNN